MPQDHKQEYDFSQITDQIFLGSNLCCEEHSYNDFLKKLGVEAEIDLDDKRRMGVPDLLHFLWLKVPDRKAPSQSQLSAGVAFLDSLVKSNIKVFVHCLYGHGRSPTLVSAYLISKGSSVKRAVERVKKARPEIHLEKEQLEALRKYESSLKD